MKIRTSSKQQIIEGQLETEACYASVIFPTIKGDKTWDLMLTLNTYQGKNVRITIEEIEE